MFALFELETYVIVINCAMSAYCRSVPCYYVITTICITFDLGARSVSTGTSRGSGCEGGGGKARWAGESDLQHSH